MKPAYSLPVKTKFADLSRGEQSKRLAQMEHLARQSGRQQPLCFCGRNEVLDDVRKLIDEAREAEDLRGMGRILQGPPGVGKTSLLQRLVEEYRNRLWSRTACISIRPDHLSTRRDALETILRAFDRDVTKTGVESLSERGGQAGLDATFVRKKAQAFTPAADRWLESGANLWRIARDSIGRSVKNKVLLLLVDETQQIDKWTEDRLETFRRIVNDIIHGDTYGIKVLPVFAGLGNTVTVLASKLISARLDINAMNLDPLSAQESREVVSKTLPQRGFSDLFEQRDLMRIATDFAAASEGWPRHVHCYMRGLAQHCHEQWSHDATVSIDMNVVMDRGHSERCNYYRQLTDGLDRTLLINLGRVIGPQRDEFAEAYLDDELGNDSVQQLVYLGLLQPTKPYSQTLEFPVPSCRTFLLEDCDFERTLSKCRAQHVRHLAGDVAQE